MHHAATQIELHDVACLHAVPHAGLGERVNHSKETMLVREDSPLTRKRARRAAGTRGSRAEELEDVTFVLPDDLLLLLVRSPPRSPAHQCHNPAHHRPSPRPSQAPS